MTCDPWIMTWTRLRKRWPEWVPNEVESDDWLHTLAPFAPGVIEDVCRFIAGQYSSRTPRLPWVLNECERREEERRTERAQTIREQDRAQSMEEFNRERERTLATLESTEVEKLREAVRWAVAEHPKWARMPKDGNIREWDRALRSLVYCHLYPEEGR